MNAALTHARMGDHVLTWLETTAVFVWSPSRDLSVRQVAAPQSSTVTCGVATTLSPPFPLLNLLHLPALTEPPTEENKKQLGNMLYEAGRPFPFWSLVSIYNNQGQVTAFPRPFSQLRGFKAF